MKIELGENNKFNFKSISYTSILLVENTITVLRYRNRKITGMEQLICYVIQNKKGIEEETQNIFEIHYLFIYLYHNPEIRFKNWRMMFFFFNRYLV